MGIVAKGYISPYTNKEEYEEQLRQFNEAEKQYKSNRTSEQKQKEWLENLSTPQEQKQKEWFEQNNKTSEQKQEKWFNEWKSNINNSVYGKAGADPNFFNNWINTSAFDDGYQFGDITKSILSTGADVTFDIVHGFGNAIEGMTDTGQYLLADLTSVFGLYENDVSKFLRKNAQFNSYDALFGTSSKEEENLFGNWQQGIENYSLSGNKLDQVSSGIGQMGAYTFTGGTLGNNILKNAMVTFTSSYGNAKSQALNNGASESDAITKALVSGLAETISENLFNAIPGFETAGFGDKVLAKVMNKKSGRVLNTILKSFEEGTEEIISNLLDVSGTYLADFLYKATGNNGWEYGKQNLSGNILKDLHDTFFAEETWDAFISAALSTAFVYGVKDVRLNTRLNNAINNYAKENNVTVEQAKADFEKVLGAALEENTTKDMNLKDKYELEDSLKSQLTKSVKQGLPLAEVAQSVRTDEQNQYHKFEFTQGEQTDYKDNEIAKNIIEKAQAANLNNTKKSHEIVKAAIKVAQELNINVDFTNNKEISQQLIKNREQKLGRELTTKEKAQLEQYASQVNGMKLGDNILLNTDSKQSAKSILGHEMKHFLEQNSKLNEELNEKLIEWAKLKGKYDTDYENMSTLYQQVKNANIIDELTANYTGEFFSSEANMKAFAVENPGLFTRIANYFKKLYYKATNQQEKLLIQEINEKIQKVYSEVSKERANLPIDRTSKADMNGNEQFSINFDFAQEYDNWDKVDRNGSFTLGTTSKALQSIGLDKRNIIIDKSKLIRIMNEHKDMTGDIIKRIPQILENPTLILKSQTDNDRIVVFGKIFDTKNKPVLVAMELNPAENNNLEADKIYKVASSYGKEKINVINNWISNPDNILYIDNKKNRTSKWLAGLGLQLPVPTNLESSSDINISQTKENVKSDVNLPLAEQLERQGTKILEEAENKRLGMIENFKEYLEENDITNPTQEDIDNSLTDILGYDNDEFSDNAKNEKLYNQYVREYMKENGIPFIEQKNITQDNMGRGLSKEQQEQFKDSKVRTPDGKLRTMYRGGNEEINVFDRKKAKSSGQEGNGFYFTTSKDHAITYGGKVKEYYLNITNPLGDVSVKTNPAYGKKTLTKEQLTKLVDSMKNNEDYSIENYGQNKTTEDIVNQIYEKPNDYQILKDLNYTAVGNMAEFVEYVNDTIGTNYDGIITDYETVVFNSNQIKDVNNKKPTSNPDIRFSLSAENNNIRDRAKEEIGLTTNLNEAGYLTDDGEYLDFSGKRQGARGGQRQMDHRDIADIYSDSQYDAAEKKYSNIGSATAIMQDFIDRGNIRLNGTGVEIAVEPTQEQYNKLYDYLEHVQKDNGDVFIDLDTETNNRENLEYNSKTSISKMINDIKEHYAKQKTQYSLSQDNQGRTLTKEQQEFYKNSAIRVKSGKYGMPEISKDGNLFEVYHGTNNDFTKFDSNYFGSSNDMGWYGPGFYFAFTEGEAKTYGSKVMKSYLNITNPFFFNEEMQTYDGKDSGDINYDFGSFMINMKNKFSDIAKKEKIRYSEYSNETGDLELKEITIDELGKKIEDIYKSKDLKMITIDDRGTEKYQYIYENDLNDYKIPDNIKKTITEERIYNKRDAKFAVENSKYYKTTQENLQALYDYYDKTNYDFSRTYIGYPNTNKEAMENSRLAEATWYVVNDVYHNLDMHMPEYYMQYLGNDMQKELIKNGYDGVVQSKSGDEIVAFYPNQIKSVNNLNPTENEDINLSLGDQNTTLQDVDKTSLSELKVKDKNSKPNLPTAQETNLPTPKKTRKQLTEAEKRVKDKVKKAIENQSYKAVNIAAKTGQNYLEFDRKQKAEFKEKLSKYIGKNQRQLTNVKTWNDIKELVESYANKELTYVDEELKTVKNDIRNRNIKITEEVKSQMDNYNEFRKENFGNLKLGNKGTTVDSLYQELSENYPYYFGQATTEADMLYEISDLMHQDTNMIQKYRIDDETLNEAVTKVYNSLMKNAMTKNDIDELQTKLEAKMNERTRTVIQEELLKDMGITLEDIAKGNDISALDTVRTDPIRLNEKVFGNVVGNKINDATIRRTKHNEAERTRWLNQQRQEIKDLGIKARSEESAAVQKYAEKEYINKYGETVKYGDAELAREFPDIKTQEKIKHAAEVLRKKYDEYIDQINNSLVQMGYKPILKRNDYMRHFQALNDVFSRFGVPLNKESMQNDSLPTDINGLTNQFKPGKEYFANALKRMGMKTEYDAITGIDGYLDGASDLIFHTEDMQRYRALAKLIRNTYGQTHGYDDFARMTPEEQAKRIEDIQSNKLAKYAAWLDEQANALANKKGQVDRAAERIFGRKVYNVLNTAKKQVGSNMTGYNVRSALTNFASAVQGASKTNKLAFLKGTISTINNIIHDDGLINKSDFLTSRFGSDSLSPKLWQKMSNAGQVFMKGTDYFTANQIWRGKYYENLQKGMSENEAIKNADDFAARIMGDRSKGSTAEVFNSKTLGFFTQFQLEVNNQWSSLIHDNKVDIQNGTKTVGSMMFQAGQLFALSYMFNSFMKALSGSKVMIDPIDLFKKIFAPDDDDEKSMEERAKDVLGDIVDDLPFVSFMTGGRIPVGEAFKGAGTLFDYVTGKKNSYGQETTLDEVKNDLLESAYYWLFPTGYGQLRKTTKGLGMYDSNLPIAGSYTKAGRLRYEVEDTPAARLQAALFGEYSSKNAREYLDKGYAPLTENQIQEVVDTGLKVNDYRKYKEGLKEQDTTEDKVDYIYNLPYSTEQKNILVNNVLNRKEDIDLTNYNQYGSLAEFDYANKNPDKYAAIKQITSYDKFLQYKDKIDDIKGEYSDTASRKAAVQRYINSLKLNKYQKVMLQKLAGGYSIKEYESEMFQYINSLNMTKAEKETLHKQLFG